MVNAEMDGMENLLLPGHAKIRWQLKVVCVQCSFYKPTDSHIDIVTDPKFNDGAQVTGWHTHTVNDLNERGSGNLHEYWVLLWHRL